MATKKAGGSSRNGRDSAGRRLGVKRYGGQLSGYTIGNVVEAVSKGLSERDLRDIIRKASRSF